MPCAEAAPVLWCRHQAALPQMPGSQQAPAHSLPVRQEVRQVACPRMLLLLLLLWLVLLL